MSWPIFQQKLKAGLRSRFVYLYFILFPLLLMSALGLVLKNNFSTSEKATIVTIAYNPQDAAIKQSFAAISTEKDSLIRTKALTPEKGQKQVKNGEVAAYVQQDGTHWRVIETQDSLYKKTVVKSFFNEMQKEIAFAKIQATTGKGSSTSEGIDVKEDKKAVRKVPTSFQYFSISMTALFTLYMVNMGPAVFGSDRNRRLSERILLSPMGKQKLLFSGYSAYFVINCAVIVVLMILTKFVFGAQWQLNPLYSFLVLVSLMANFYTLGFLGDTLAFNGTDGLLNILIQLFAFLGGGYFQTSSLMKSFSPLGWGLDGLQSALWTTNNLVWWPLILNALWGVLFYMISAWIVQRREVF